VIDEKVDAKLWRFIPLDEFSSPAEPPAEQVRAGVYSYFERLRNGITAFTPANENPVETRTHPEISYDRRRFVPGTHWPHSTLAALEEALGDWRTAGKTEAGCMVLIKPPRSGLDRTLIEWAIHHEMRIIQPPNRQQLLHAPVEWWAQLPLDQNERWVLPHLERCFLRHHEGLALIRDFIQILWQRQLPCVLGCDSWAWSYLRETCGAGLLCPRPLVLAPLHATDLSRWFFSTMRDEEANTIVFRRTQDGKQVLPIHHHLSDESTISEDEIDEDDTDESEQDEVKKEESFHILRLIGRWIKQRIRSHKRNHNGAAEDNDDLTAEFLTHIAAYSRGNPAVARALWERSLAISHEHAMEKEVSDKAAADPGETVWVRKWDTMDLPAIPDDLGDHGALLLHALLLHNGLAYEELVYMLPIHPTRLVEELRQLEVLGLIHVVEPVGELSAYSEWQVTPLGYPAVRRFLREEGYWLDSL
jgi:DNA-binding HxlR family transcriptional regulator